MGMGGDRQGLGDGLGPQGWTGGHERGSEVVCGQEDERWSSVTWVGVDEGPPGH